MSSSSIGNGARRVQTGCCIVGGGPAGMMLAVLLARAGVDVVVLEKHEDFLRDFRGDTIHPSTLEVMHELGLLSELLRRPHQELRELRAWIGDRELHLVDFSHVPARCRFLALMPQWDFLDFLAAEGRRYPGFHLEMGASLTDLVEEGGRVVGAIAETPRGRLEVRAELTIGADGRHSDVRAKSGLPITEIGAPMDVLWLRLSRRPGDPEQAFGRIRDGRFFIMIDRRDYWQCGFLIPKGGFEELKRRGLSALRDEIAFVAPLVADRVDQLRDWDDVKLLTVRVDRMRRWYRAGLLCIGDAAHAMSPIGGVGINLAIQDAVAAANRLAGPLLRGAVSDADLRAVQRRREWPTRATQRLQVFVQELVIRRALGKRRTPRPGRLVSLFDRVSALRRIPARLIGIGFRAEHVKTREIAGAARRRGSTTP